VVLNFAGPIWVTPTMSSPWPIWTSSAKEWRDGGYRDTEIVRWLFTRDPSLTVTRDGTRDAINNARPVDALHAHQAREVLRRAQAMAY